MRRRFRIRIYFLFLLTGGIFLSTSCVSHLKEAKYYYAQGQKLARNYQTEKALASFKKAQQEAELESQRNPSAQAYMIKGMAELSLEMWEKAEESFIGAFTHGFERGEEWANQLSLLGVASSLQELGLAESSSRVYFYLLQKSKIQAITVFAAHKYTDLSLQKALEKGGKKRLKMLSQLLKAVEKLSEKDLSCGYYHYLQSQILGHLSEYKRAFEKAVMARELGLPSQEIFRDNDNQVVFCYQNLKGNLSQEEWGDFQKIYLQWVKKWGWLGPETPAWKKR
jgi:hypothetical protein